MCSLRGLRPCHTARVVLCGGQTWERPCPCRCQPSRWDRPVVLGRGQEEED